MTSLPAYFGAVPCVASKNADVVADVGAGRHAEAADLRRAGVRQVVAVQVRRGEHVVLVGARQHLLEHAVGDAVLDDDLAVASTRRAVTSSSVTIWSRNSALATS